MADTGKDALWLVPPVVINDIGNAPPETALLNSHLASIRLRTGVAAAGWQRAVVAISAVALVLRGSGETDLNSLLSAP